MASILIGRRQRQCKFVESAILKYFAKIARALEELLKPFLQGEEAMPDFRMMLVLLGRYMASIRVNLTASEEALQNELDDDAAVRDEREEALSGLFTLLFRIRDSVTSSHGPRALEAFGFESRTERNTERLLNQAQRVCGILRDSEAELPAPLFRGFTVDREALLEELVAAHGRLAEAVDQVDIEVREADEMLIAKTDTMDTFDNGYLWSARLVEAFLRLIGEPELADRIRPSQNRLDRSDIEENDLGASEPEPTEPTEPEPTTPEPADSTPEA